MVSPDLTLRVIGRAGMQGYDVEVGAVQRTDATSLATLAVQAGREVLVLGGYLIWLLVHTVASAGCCCGLLGLERRQG